VPAGAGDLHAPGPGAHPRSLPLPPACPAACPHAAGRRRRPCGQQARYWLVPAPCGQGGAAAAADRARWAASRTAAGRGTAARVRLPRRALDWLGREQLNLAGVSSGVSWQPAQNTPLVPSQLRSSQRVRFEFGLRAARGGVDAREPDTREASR
jgi:hypothetical protein